MHNLELQVKGKLTDHVFMHDPTKSQQLKHEGTFGANDLANGRRLQNTPRQAIIFQPWDAHYANMGGASLK